MRKRTWLTWLPLMCSLGCGGPRPKPIETVRYVTLPAASCLSKAPPSRPPAPSCLSTDVVTCSELQLAEYTAQLLDHRERLERWARLWWQACGQPQGVAE